MQLSNAMKELDVAFIVYNTNLGSMHNLQCMNYHLLVIAMNKKDLESTTRYEIFARILALEVALKYRLQIKFLSLCHQYQESFQKEDLLMNSLGTRLPLAML